MNILVLCVELPFPPVGGGLMRTYQILKALSLQHNVTLIGFTYDDKHTEADLPIEVIPVPWELPYLYRQMHNEEGEQDLYKQAYRILAYDIPEPWYASYFGLKTMTETISQVTSQKQFDLVLIEDSDMAQYIPVLPAGVPRVLDMHNFYSLMAKRSLEKADDDEREEKELEYKRTVAYEKYVTTQCNICLTCSEQEASAVKKLLEIDHVEVIPNGVDLQYFKPFVKEPTPATLLFTGTMSYAPNVEGIIWFVKNVLPAVTNKIPGVMLHVVGTSPVEEVRKLKSEQIRIHGRVPDMRPYFEAASVYIAPVLSGGGTRLKILEAAASGKAIVSTSIGAEGINLKPGEEILIADTASEFAETICHLLTDKQSRTEMEQAVSQPMHNYDWKVIQSKLGDLIASFDKTQKTGLRPPLLYNYSTNE